MANEEKKKASKKVLKATATRLIEKAFRLGCLKTRYEKAYNDTRKAGLAALAELGQLPAKPGDCLTFDGGDLKRFGSNEVTVQTGLILQKVLTDKTVSVDKLLSCVKSFDVEKLKETFSPDVVTETVVPGDLRFTANGDVKKLVASKADGLDTILFDLIKVEEEKEEHAA
jgi:hypothetical protein